MPARGELPILKAHHQEVAMTREDVLMRIATMEPDGGKWGAIERYADVLAKMEWALSDRQMAALVEVGARLVRLEYPDVFRVVRK
jgi:hypothetical protein